MIPRYIKKEELSREILVLLAQDFSSSKEMQPIEEKMHQLRMLSNPPPTKTLKK